MIGGSCCRFGSDRDETTERARVYRKLQEKRKGDREYTTVYHSSDNKMKQGCGYWPESGAET
eukprot:7927987-Pyramimonas_sp.AAC.1